MQMYYVADVHFAKVTCVEWSQNTLKLFSGDELGSVACTEMDYGQVGTRIYRLILRMVMIGTFCNCCAM